MFRVEKNTNNSRTDNGAKIKGIAVVLAIGLIWALFGIGIMYMFGLVQNTDEAQNDVKYAAEVNTCCTVYYSSVIKGSYEAVNGEEVSLFPEIGSDMSKREEFARTKTLGDALEFAGVGNKYDDVLPRLKVGSGGKIIASSEAAKASDQTGKDIVLSRNTTLGEIYGN